VLLGMSGLVLLVACADVAGLLLARGEKRRRELAVRMAIGASRAHVVRQLLAEGLLLAAVGAAAGALLAAWGSEALLAAIPPEVALPVDAARPVLDPRVLAFAALAALASGLGASLVPALRACRPQLVPALRDESGATAGAGRAALRGALVVSQVALSCVLLVGAGLLLRTLLELNRVDTGYSTHGVVLATADLAKQGYDEARSARAFQELLESLRATPGIDAASLARSAPVQSAGMRVSVEPDGYVKKAGELVVSDYNVVTPGHFAALGVSLLRGRDFAATDQAGSPLVAVVNQAAAERWWPGQDPIGKRLGDMGPATAPVTVVGVVANAKLRELRESPEPIIYASFAQFPLPRMTFVVRSHLSPREATSSLRAAVARVDPELPLFRVRTLEEQLQASLARERLLAGLFMGFGALALALAWAGLYGLVSFVTTARTREIGVRMALGAGARDVLGLVLGQSLRLAAAGLALGLVAAVALARLLTGVLYQVTPLDAPTLAAVAFLLLAAAAAAGQLPARRAMRIEPATALRHD
jgi:putative ABC transport system permease protein